MATRETKPAFGRALPRSEKAEAGRTGVESTPIKIRSRAAPVSAELGTSIRERLARAVGRFAPLIERGTVRFEDVNGPRGGADTVCRIRLVLSGMPAVVATGIGQGPAEAFAYALPRVEAAAASRVGKRARSAPAASRRGGRATRAPDAKPSHG